MKMNTHEMKRNLERFYGMPLSSPKFVLKNYEAETSEVHWFNSIENAQGGDGKELYYGKLIMSIKKDSAEPITEIEIINDGVTFCHLSNVGVTPVTYTDYLIFEDILFSDIKIIENKYAVSYQFIGYSFKILG